MHPNREIHPIKDDVREKTEQNVLERAHRPVGPAGQGEISANDFAADIREFFGQQPKRANPTAKSALKKEGNGQDRGEDQQSRGMDGMDDAGLQPEPGAHQGADGQKGFHAWWPWKRWVAGIDAGMVKGEELPANQQAKGRKNQLHEPALSMRLRALAKAKQPLDGGRCCGPWPLERRRSLPGGR